MTKTKVTKHAGAAWLLATLTDLDKPLMSDLGVKVANVLGQVFKGVYHAEKEVTSKYVGWDNPYEITVTVWNEFASFDSSRLTLLLLCCEQAGILVEFYGSFGSSTRLIFKPTNPGTEWAPFDLAGADTVQEIALEMKVKRTLFKRLDDDDIVFAALYTIAPPSWNRVISLVATAHEKLLPRVPRRAIAKIS